MKWALGNFDGPIAKAVCVFSSVSHLYNLTLFGCELKSPLFLLLSRPTLILTVQWWAPTLNALYWPFIMSTSSHKFHYPLTQHIYLDFGVLQSYHFGSGIDISCFKYIFFKKLTF
jgi:hypothetical protein